MRLATKLFLIVGSLFLLVCLAVFLLPEYIIRMHIDEDRAIALESFEERRRTEQDQYFVWLAKTIDWFKGFIDANLILIADHTFMQRLLELNEPEFSDAIWFSASDFLWNPGAVDFLQVVRNDSEAVTLSFGAAPIHESHEIRLSHDLSWVATVRDGSPLVLLGVYYPEELDRSEGVVKTLRDPDTLPALFLLFDPEQIWRDRDRYRTLLEEHRGTLGDFQLTDVTHAGVINLYVLESLVRAEEELERRFPTLESLQGHLSDLSRVSLEKDSEDPLLEYYRGLVGGDQTLDPSTLKRSFSLMVSTEDDQNMMSAVGVVCAPGVICESPLDGHAPVGVLHAFANSNRGVTMFSSDVFYDRQLFDLKEYLESHPGIDEVRLPLHSFDIVPKEDVGVLTMVNTMFWEAPNGTRTAITLGVQVDDFVDELGDISGQASFLIYRDRVLDVSFPEGAALTSAQQEELVSVIPALKDHGRITLAGREFFYSRYVPEEGWQMSFVTLEPVDEAMASYDAYVEHSKEMLRRFSYQLLGLAVGLFVLSLIVLELIARRFTKPIRALASAADEVGQGHYEDVELPSAVEGSKDEVSILTGAFGSMVSGLREREKIRAALDKVVSKEVANEILKGHIELGGEVREVTVLFSDIRNFTHLSENLPPEEVIAFLNGYMTRMAGIIEGHLGVIDKYVGDEVMALYGAPVGHKLSALQAVLSAILMRSSLADWNRERSSSGVFTAEAGIGIHTGSMVAGNMGAENRLNYTVLGANVNLASRICDQAQPGEVLITEAVLNSPEVRDVIEVEVGTRERYKGITEPVQVYRVLGLQRGRVLEDLSSRLRQFMKDE